MKRFPARGFRHQSLAPHPDNRSPAGPFAWVEGEALGPKVAHGWGCFFVARERASSRGMDCELFLLLHFFAMLPRSHLVLARTATAARLAGHCRAVRRGTAAAAGRRR